MIRYGKNSPLNHEVLDEQTGKLRQLEITDMPLCTVDDVKLLDDFFAYVEKNPNLTDPIPPELTKHLERLDFLDKYLNIPILKYSLDRSLEALNNCIINNSDTPKSYIRTLQIPRNIKNNIHMLAVTAGYLEMYIWLEKIKCPMDYSLTDFELAIITTKNGHLHMLKYLLGKYNYDEYHDTSRIAYTAVQCDQVHILDWLYENKFIGKNSFSCTDVQLCPLTVFDWMLSKPEFMHDELCINASRYRNFHLIEKIHGKTCLCPKQNMDRINLQICVNAIKNNDLSAIKHMHKHHWPMNHSKEICELAVIDLKYDILQYLYENGYRCKEDILDTYVSNVQILDLLYLFGHRISDKFVMPKFTVWYDVLEWYVTHGFNDFSLRSPFLRWLYS